MFCAAIVMNLNLAHNNINNMEFNLASNSVKITLSSIK